MSCQLTLTQSQFQSLQQIVKCKITVYSSCLFLVYTYLLQYNFIYFTLTALFYSFDFLFIHICLSTTGGSLRTFIILLPTTFLSWHRVQVVRQQNVIKLLVRSAKISKVQSDTEYIPGKDANSLKH